MKSEHEGFLWVVVGYVIFVVIPSLIEVWVKKR